MKYFICVVLVLSLLSLQISGRRIGVSRGRGRGRGKGLGKFISKSFGSSRFRSGQFRSRSNPANGRWRSTRSRTVSGRPTTSLYTNSKNIAQKRTVNSNGFGHGKLESLNRYINEQVDIKNNSKNQHRL